MIPTATRGNFLPYEKWPRAGLMPNIKENPRKRQTPKRGRKRCFNQAIHAFRERVERTFAWEDNFKRSHSPGLSGRPMSLRW